MRLSSLEMQAHLFFSPLAWFVQASSAQKGFQAGYLLYQVAGLSSPQGKQNLASYFTQVFFGAFDFSKHPSNLFAYSAVAPYSKFCCLNWGTKPLHFQGPLLASQLKRMQPLVTAFAHMECFCT